MKPLLFLKVSDNFKGEPLSLDDLSFEVRSLQCFIGGVMSILLNINF